MNQKKKRVSRGRIPIVLTLFALVVFKTILFIGYVPTSSMEPTLDAGSYIVGSRVVGELDAGDIIIFRHEGQLLVKRIAWCPGDLIDLRSIEYMDSIAIPVWDDPLITVPENCFYVLGDNTENSIDSRYWDDPFVGTEDIVAKLILY